MPRYRIIEKIEYELDAADDFTAMRAFLTDPNKHFKAVTEREVMVDRDGTGKFVEADADEIERAEAAS